MEKQKTDWKQAFKFMGAVLAFAIGSGFATGQELLQYFTAYGYQSILVGIVFLVIFIYSNYCFAVAGNREKFSKGSEVFKYYCGPILGTVFDYFSVIFCYMSYIVMVAGAASTLKQQYNVPLVAGGVIIATLVCATAVFGLNSIVNVISKIGPVLVIIALIIGFFNFIVAAVNGHVSEGAQLVSTGEIQVMKASSNWFMAGASYGGFCLLWFAGFMAELGSKNRLKELMIGQVMSGTFNILACVIVGFALLGNITNVSNLQIPNLYLANQMWAPLGYFFALIIFAAIYTTACPLLWTASSRFTTEGTPKFKILTVVLAVIGLIVALAVPFNILLNYIYVINGYGGFILLIIMFVKNTYLRFTSKKEKPSLQSQSK